MQKTLVIYAHPGAKGHCWHIKEELLKKLEEYELLDLNKIKFDPVLKKEELYTMGNRTEDTQIKKLQNKIKNYKKRIFIYPIWWGTTPAILKGFIDRVLTSHFAFKFENYPMMGAVPKGLLEGKALVFCTTGSKSWQAKIFLRDRYKKNINNEILGFCGIKTKVLALHNAIKWDESKTPKVQKMIKKGLNWLNL